MPPLQSDIPGAGAAGVGSATLPGLRASRLRADHGGRGRGAVPVVTEEAKRRLAAILARDPMFGCRCPDCTSEITWASELARLRFYAPTCCEPEDREAALDRFWEMMT